MKKIFTLVVALGTLSTVFAQQTGYYYSEQRDSRNVSYQGRNDDHSTYGSSSNTVQYGHNVGQQNNRYEGQQNAGYQGPQNTRYEGQQNNHYEGQQNSRGYNDRQRQQEMDRINHDYDNRIGGYRNDRSLNTYERNRRIQETERERNSRLKSFGGGVILGGVLGVLLGSHL